jgi:hypothetical protein
MTMQTVALSSLLRRGREITMPIVGEDPFETGKPDARLIKLLIRARRFNATLVDGDGVPHPSHSRRAAAARSDTGQAAGALASALGLGRATDPTRLRPNSRDCPDQALRYWNMDQQRY